jgi:DNA-binding response OmpR family regulator
VIPVSRSRRTARTSWQGDRVRLLVVEDEARLARALRRGLTADGFTVDLAHDGVLGLARAREGQYDAVLLDVMLPGISGYEVVRRLRAEDNWVPVMMVSAKDGPHDQADGLDYGADDYLTKPFDYVVLLARLRALLRRQSDPRPPVLTHGDVRLDPATREVTLAGEHVSLSRREYDLLEFFLRHPDRVVTKTELLDRVWDARGVGYEPNTVEVYVGYLRRKLGSGLIETVRGAGYRLAR